jgi:hypothetical protein
MGSSDEFTARSVTVLFLFIFSLVIFFSLRKVPGLTALNGDKGDGMPPISLLVPLMVVTSGRILFWDSMLALIDICFSMVIYSLFMVVYFQGVKGRFGKLFVLSYLLAAIGFLLKGLPALMFLTVTILTWFTWKRQWRHFFSLKHLTGLFLFVLLTGGYYFLYSWEQPLDTVLSTLFHESAKRTFIQYGIWESLKEATVFPVEMLYHFLPWTIFAIYFFNKRSRTLALQNQFIKWNLLVLLTTIAPYWLSVEVYPRYIIMHVPLFFTVVLYLHATGKSIRSRWPKALEMLFFGLCLAAFTATLVPLLLESMQQVAADYKWKVLFLALISGVLGFLYWSWKSERLLLLVAVLLVVRIGFNWFVLPERLDFECSTKVRESTLSLARKYPAENIQILEHSLGFQPVTGYYYTRETGKVLRACFDDFDLNTLYILNPDTYPPATYTKLDSLTIKWECRKLYLGRINNTMLELINSRKKE